MRAEAKICGVRDPSTLAAALHFGAAYIGFVHFPKSPRHLALESAGALARQSPDRSVLLLVDPELELVDTAMEVVRPSILQLHGSESPKFLAEVQRRHDVKLWKALAVRTASDLAAARDYAGLADRILFDAKPPPGSNLPGGNGLRFDWELLRGVTIDQPWGLSGGLDPANVAEAIRITKAPLVDVSSGVEDAPGQKNVDKMAAFLNAVQQS